MASYQLPNVTSVALNEMKTTQMDGKRYTYKDMFTGIQEEGKWKILTLKDLQCKF